MKKLLLLSLAAILLISITLLAIPAKADVHEVWPGESIQAAINAASDGDIVFVHSGTYNESIKVNKTISLIGENRKTTIINGRGLGTIVRVTVNNVTISGFTITNAGGVDKNSVLLVNVRNCNISGNIMSLSYAGISLQSLSSNNLISRNNITANGYGIRVGSSSGNNLFGNNITDNFQSGIEFHRMSPSPYYSINNVVSRNNITNNRGESIVFENSPNNTILENRIANNLRGVLFQNSSYNTVSRNNITANIGDGLIFQNSLNNTITENTITANNGDGMRFHLSSNNILKDNIMTDNAYNFGVYGKQLPDFINDVDNSNIVNGKPMYYWINKSSDNIPLDAGYIAIVNSTNITVQNLNISNNVQGILLAYTRNSKVENVTIKNNRYGIWLFESLYNDILRNNIVTNDAYGILFNASSNNRIYHNNFINNAQQAYCDLANSWHIGWPLGGNYWSNMAHVDIHTGPDQNLTGTDGIVDKKYNITAQYQDMYPLVAPWTPHNIAVVNMLRYRTVVGNETNSAFNINVIVANRGIFVENSTLTISMNSSNIISKSFNVTATWFKSVLVTLNTSGLEYGNYTIGAYAHPVSEETNIIDNSFTGGWVSITIVGDVKYDKTVNVLDLILVAGHLGHEGDGGHVKYTEEWYDCMNTDINSDTKRNVLDLIKVASNLGQSWGP